MERLYRPGAEMIMTEPPAGAIEPGEEPMEAARRELREETGYEAESMEFLCKICLLYTSQLTGQLLMK